MIKFGAGGLSVDKDTINGETIGMIAQRLGGEYSTKYGFYRVKFGKSLARIMSTKTSKGTGWVVDCGDKSKIVYRLKDLYHALEEVKNEDCAC